MADAGLLWKIVVEHVVGNKGREHVGARGSLANNVSWGNAARILGISR